MAVICVIAHDRVQHVPDRWTNQSKPIAPVLPERDVRYVHLTRGAPLEIVVQRILSAKRPDETIVKLYLLAHGDSGQVCLPGQYADPLEFLTLSTVDRFALLSPHFWTLHRQIEIHVSGVASDTPVQRNGQLVPGTWKGDGSGAGYRFMKRLAEATGASVWGALNFEPNPARFGGRTVLVHPDGEFTRL